MKPVTLIHGVGAVTAIGIRSLLLGYCRKQCSRLFLLKTSVVFNFQLSLCKLIVRRIAPQSSFRDTMGRYYSIYDTWFQRGIHTSFTVDVGVVIWPLPHWSDSNASFE